MDFKLTIPEPLATPIPGEDLFEVAYQLMQPNYFATLYFGKSPRGEEFYWIEDPHGGQVLNINARQIVSLDLWQETQPACNYITSFTWPGIRAFYLKKQKGGEVHAEESKTKNQETPSPEAQAKRKNKNSSDPNPKKKINRRGKSS